MTSLTLVKESLTSSSFELGEDMQDPALSPASADVLVPASADVTLLTATAGAGPTGEFLAVACAQSSKTAGEQRAVEVLAVRCSCGIPLQEDGTRGRAYFPR
jgi:hypothetical protein